MSNFKIDLFNEIISTLIKNDHSEKNHHVLRKKMCNNNPARRFYQLKLDKLDKKRTIKFYFF